MVNINVQKKDLWLLSAIMIFLVGVAFVIAYGSGQPSVHGHDAGEVEGIGATYDSGWFACSAVGTYPLTHNLGTQNIIAQILFAPDSGGSPDLTQVIAVDYTNWGDVIRRQGSMVQDITNTQLTLQAGNYAVAFRLDTGGMEITYASGHCKVIARAI